MLRRMMIALMATVALGVLAPEAASARGGGFGGGHGFGGGGFHGGFGGGGFHGGGGGWHGGVAAFHGAPMGGGVGFHQVGIGGPHFVGGFHPGFHRRVFIAGAGFAPYGYDDGYYPYYGYPAQGYYDDGYVEESSCSIVRQPVRTPYGLRYRTVQICQ
jgi:hypothetical protein